LSGKQRINLHPGGKTLTKIAERGYMPEGKVSHRTLLPAAWVIQKNIQYIRKGQ
jgi:hypothetical protein